MGVAGGAKSIAAQDKLVVCIDFMNPNCYTDGATTATNIGSLSLDSTSIPAAWSNSSGHMLCTVTYASFTSTGIDQDGQSYELWIKPDDFNNEGLLS